MKNHIPPTANVVFQPQGMTIELPATQTTVRFCTESIIRVSVSPNPPVVKAPSLVVTPPEESLDPDFFIKEKEITLTLNRLQIAVDLQSGRLQFRDKVNQAILEEPGENARELQPVEIAGEATFSATQKFRIHSREALYGLGQFQESVMNYRGHEVLLAQANQIVAVPFLVSTAGYGILWDNYSATKFSAKDNLMTWQAEVADAIEYYFIYGPALDDVISGYRQLTGAAPLFAKWAYGYLQSKERYVDREDLLRTVQRFREQQIPLDVIIQDWRYWGELGWNAMEFDLSVFPEPAEMIRELHEKFHTRIMISIWPAFGATTKVYQALDTRGYLFPGEFWADGRVYDAFSSEARDIYWHWLKKGLFDLGIDAWWMDGTEPEFKSTDDQTITGNEIRANKKNALGTWARYLNAFSLMTTRGVYEHQRATTEAKRVCILTRSAFAGQQKYAAATWSGDITASWDVFRKQISAGLNFCLAGIPYWTTDIGAFFVKKQFPNGCKDPNYQELFVRWFQYGTFCPLFRAHGTDTPREPWHFGAPGSPVYNTLLKFNHLRHRLLPYIYSLAWQVTRGYTLMRGLAMDFPNDPKVRRIDDQFMFGPALLVNPVTHPGDIQSVKEVPEDKHPATRELYLPNSNWFDFWTGRQIAGKQKLTVSAPLEILPLYVRAGSILPLGPFVQYATEKPADPLELRIYPGADGEFTLYEDEDDNYEYEKGAFALIHFTWEDATQTLKISVRQGSFPGMLRKRTFEITRVGVNQGISLEPNPDPERVVTYCGKAVEVMF